MHSLYINMGKWGDITCCEMTMKKKISYKFMFKRRQCRCMTSRY